MGYLELMMVVTCKIWFRRNNVLHGGEFTHPNQVFQEPSNSLDDFRRINIQELDTRSPIHEESPTLCKKPPIGINKVNRDVVVEKTHG